MEAKKRKSYGYTAADIQYSICVAISTSKFRPHYSHTHTHQTYIAIQNIVASKNSLHQQVKSLDWSAPAAIEMKNDTSSLLVPKRKVFLRYTTVKWTTVGLTVDEPSHIYVVCIIVTGIITFYTIYRKDWH
jgi:hypothetical protein